MKDTSKDSELIRKAISAYESSKLRQQDLAEAQQAINPIRGFLSDYHEPKQSYALLPEAEQDPCANLLLCYSRPTSHGVMVQVGRFIACLKTGLS